MGGITQKMTDTVKKAPIAGLTGVHAVAVLTDPSNGQVYGHVDFVELLIGLGISLEKLTNEDLNHLYKTASVC